MTHTYDDRFADAIEAAQQGKREGMEACLHTLERPLLQLVQSYGKLTDRRGERVDQQELYNEAVLNTIENIHLFRPNRALPDQSIRNQFARYYVDHARPRLRELCQRAIRTVDIPEWAAKYAPRIHRAIRELERTKGHNFSLRTPNPEELAAMTGVPLSKVKLFLARGLHLSASRQYEDTNGKEEGHREDITTDTGTESVGLSILESATLTRETKNIISLAWQSLSPREKQVLAMRFGFDCDPCSRRAISQALSLSDHEVREAEAMGLATIKEVIEISSQRVGVA